MVPDRKRLELELEPALRSDHGEVYAAGSRGPRGDAERRAERLWVREAEPGRLDGFERRPGRPNSDGFAAPACAEAKLYASGASMGSTDTESDGGNGGTIPFACPRATSLLNNFG